MLIPVKYHKRKIQSGIVPVKRHFRKEYSFSDKLQGRHLVDALKVKAKEGWNSFMGKEPKQTELVDPSYKVPNANNYQPALRNMQLLPENRYFLAEKKLTGGSGF